MTVRATVIPIRHAGASPYAPLTPQQVAQNLRPLSSAVLNVQPKGSSDA
jgi:hypothetical protein